jgi:hypothetical protein
MMESIFEKKKINEDLEGLLDQFERDVEPYDKLSYLSMLFTPISVILSIFIPLLWLRFTAGPNPYFYLTSIPTLYWIVGSILVNLFCTKLLIFYVDYKKHEISKTRYKPLSGVCMCDLSQLRSFMRKREKAKTLGERIRYGKLIDYYKNQIGWQ